MEGMAKTPVAILNERMTKKAIIPVYELIADCGSGTNQPMFKYQVTCDKVVAQGAGRCKKIAKHDAAEAMLRKLGIMNIEGACSLFETGTLHQLAETVEEKPMQVLVDQSETPSKNLNLNATQELLNLCKARSFSTPEFTTSCSGPPHAPYFTVSCKVENYLEKGLATSKKVAKKDAAQKMVNRIKEMDESKSKVQEIVNSTFESSNNAISDHRQSIQISQLTKREQYLLSLCDKTEKKLKEKSPEKTLPPEIEEQLDVVKKSIEKLLSLI